LQVYDISNEALIADRHHALSGLFNFLDISADAALIDRLSAGIYSKPNTSRSEISWPPQLVEYVMKRKATMPWIAGYDFYN